MSRAWRLAALCLIASRAAAQPDVPDGFAVEAVVLDPFAGAPIGFAFLPDGRFRALPVRIQSQSGERAHGKIILAR